MRRVLAVTFALVSTLPLTFAVFAQTSSSNDDPKKKEEPPKILGECAADAMEQEPYDKWYVKGFEAYEPNAEIVERLSAVDRSDITLDVFFGTWCGDSRREVPHLVKLMKSAGFDMSRVNLIGVNNVAEQHKQSPDGEHVGQSIYRVPTVVVRRSGEEIARIVEFPVLSLERDLLAILSGQPYQPNYKSYPTVSRWFDEGLLSDANISAYGLAEQVREQVRSEGELAAAARVMLTRGDVDEAVKLLEVNMVLHRDSARSWERLADAQHKAGQIDKARRSAERALTLNEDPARVAALVKLVDRTYKPEEEKPVEEAARR